tara:strand:+ start:66 stop:455 length:390 start_codon:yes stop_codon:yes gene_type:complete
MTTSEQQVTIWLNENQTSIDELYVELAKLRPQSTAFGGNLVKQGRSIFINFRTQLYNKICSNEKIINHPAIGGSENVAEMIGLVALVASCIETDVIAKSINVMLIATLVVRIGIRKFCEYPVTVKKTSK